MSIIIIIIIIIGSAPGLPSPRRRPGYARLACFAGAAVDRAGGTKRRPGAL